ncbi:unnamed protein product [Dimorphilus gyrociliatus]|uniref:RING-type domain-containing protein n=1 Tax=Dimorphilus gyrociliatus TaxID=2664684 RepID=A0A7I8V6C5_9ANNE|nr:unnamed protein product [Dimorphilus gyrociliatus]
MSTQSEEDMDINELISKEDMECAFCKCLWIGNSPRCLPCKTVIHIFCSECLEKWAGSKAFENGGFFSCPICQHRYKWTRDGVNAFPRLGIFHNFLEKKYHSQTFKESKVKYVRSDTEKTLVSYLKDSGGEMNCLISKIKTEVINSIMEIRKKEKRLIGEIKEFCSNQENDIKSLLDNFEKLQYSILISDEIIENTTKSKMELTNQAAYLMNKKLHFHKKQDGNLGEISTVEHFQQKNPIIKITEDERVLNVTYFKNRLYIILEKMACKYKLILFDIENSRSEILKKWNTYNSETYKLAAGVRLYFLTIGKDEIKFVNSNSTTSNSYSFDVFCAIDKKNDKYGYYHNMVEYDDGIIICLKCEDKNSVTKLKDPFKVDWDCVLPSDYGLVLDIAVNNNNIFLCTDSLRCTVLDFSTGRILFDCNYRINGSISLSTSECSTSILALNRQGALFRVFNTIVLAQLEANSNGLILTTKSYKDIFDLYTLFAYKVHNGIINLILIRDGYLSLITIK